MTLANMTQAEDGKWATVAAGGRDLMRHAPAADHVLKALTRHELVTTFGVEFTRNRRSGAWEVGAIPDETLQVFSQRGMDIQRVLDQLGVTNATASDGHRNLAEFHNRGHQSLPAVVLGHHDPMNAGHGSRRQFLSTRQVSGGNRLVLLAPPRERPNNSITMTYG